MKIGLFKVSLFNIYILNHIKGVALILNQKVDGIFFSVLSLKKKKKGQKLSIRL